MSQTNKLGLLFYSNNCQTSKVLTNALDNLNFLNKFEHINLDNNKNIPSSIKESPTIVLNNNEIISGENTIKWINFVISQKSKSMANQGLDMNTPYNNHMHNNIGHPMNNNLQLNNSNNINPNNYGQINANANINVNQNSNYDNLNRQNMTFNNDINYQNNQTQSHVSYPNQNSNNNKNNMMNNINSNNNNNNMSIHMI